MEVALRPIQEIIPYARNARSIPPAAIDKVAASIREFGWRQPIVVDEKGIVVAGHTRLLGAQKLGLHEVPVHVATGLTDAQIKAYRLMDNRSHQESAWDDSLLAIELGELRDLAVDLSLTGFGAIELDELFARTSGRDGLTDDDEAPELPNKPISQTGDLWHCGPHRVLCGDATSGSDLQRLLGEERADLVFTDPPYNVAYQGYTEEKLTIQGDKMTAPEFADFLQRAFLSYRSAVKPGASLYVCHASSCQREFQSAIESAGFDVRCQIIWAKNTFAWWYGDKTQSTLWQEKKPAANRLHPTMKPVELIERALLNSSKSGDLVVDLFGGLGSTMIACEKRVRAARLAEIDPRYTDVIVRRWQEFSGSQAVLGGAGQPFVNVEHERKERL